MTETMSHESAAARAASRPDKTTDAKRILRLAG